jgi:broad specificity phosphatase PhoE
MKRLLLVRHGETQWNKEERFIGISDIPLNQEGRDQAVALAERLRDEPIEVIYSSEFQRALETAQVIARDHDLNVHVTDGLREVSYGDWEGLTVDDVEAKTGFRFPSRFEAPQVPFPSNSMVQEVLEDIQGFLEHLLGSEEAKTILLVGHGVSFQMILYQLLEVPFRYHWLFYMYNASISEVLVVNGEAVLVRLNDTNHL